MKVFSNNPICWLLPVSAFCLVLGYNQDLESNRKNEIDASESNDLRTIVASAFAEIHEGWSSDEVLLQPELNRRFIDACVAQRSDLSEFDCNWTLINLRKAGLLKTKTTRRTTPVSADAIPVAEIASRTVTDRHKVTLDRVFCDPKLRAEFDQVVQSIDPKAEIYPARKAAFQLRKQRRLQPELVARIADWGRQIQSYSYQQLTENPDLIPSLPGIYIFLDASGYLYIGQTDNLNTRLKTHFRKSHNFSLSEYIKGDQQENVMIEIHSFPAESRAKETMIRRAYESELIASRKPRFNILP